MMRGADHFPVRGRHLLADMSGIDPALLIDPSRLMELLQRATVLAGFGVVGEHVHQLESGGAGMTGVLILTQSHVIIHTYPEVGFVALDIYFCGDHDPHAVLRSLVAYC